jgi:hypothetical protein
MDHAFILDKMLEGTRVRLQEKKQDLKGPKAALVEAQARAHNLWDNQDLLAELVELRDCLGGVLVYRVTEAEVLTALVADISTVLVDLGLAPIQGIPQVPNKARVVLKAMGVPGRLLRCSPYFFSGPCAIIFFMFCCCLFIKEPGVYQYLFLFRGS